MTMYILLPASLRELERRVRCIKIIQIKMFTLIDCDTTAGFENWSTREAVFFDCFKASYIQDTSVLMAKKSPFLKPFHLPKASWVHMTFKHCTSASNVYTNTTKSNLPWYLPKTTAMVTQKPKHLKSHPHTPCPRDICWILPKSTQDNFCNKKQSTQNILECIFKILPESQLACNFAEELKLELTSTHDGSAKEWRDFG